MRPQLYAAPGNPFGEGLERLLFREVGVRVVQMIRERAQLAGFELINPVRERLHDVFAFI